MGYQMLTRTGRSFWECTSIMQNAIRKGDYDIAGHAMWELLPGYIPYLRKRLLVISAEDCFGIITKEIVALADIGTEESLTKALWLLCESKKNRDADYFVCNLMIPDERLQADNYELSRMLTTAIQRFDVVKAGRISATLFKKKRAVLWDALVTLAQTQYPYLLKEVEALRISNERMSKPNEETVFVSKAIVLMWTKREPLEGILGHEKIDFDNVMPFDKIEIIKTLDMCPVVRGVFPDCYYNWHTTRGKYELKLDAVHAIENDQELLTPLEENLFDDCTWDRDLDACLRKWNPRRRILPYSDGKIKPEDKFRVDDEGGGGTPEPEPEQMNIFDIFK